MADPSPPARPPHVAAKPTAQKAAPRRSGLARTNVRGPTAKHTLKIQETSP